jgi:hypothetical protein
MSTAAPVAKRAQAGSDAVAKLLALAQANKDAEPVSKWANVQVVSADYDDQLEEEAEDAMDRAQQVRVGGEGWEAEDEHAQQACEDV